MIKDLKELERLLKLCRKQGVTEIVWEGLSLKLGDAPSKPAAADGAEAESDGAGEGTYIEGLGMVPPGMTPEQFMFMSSPSPQPSES